MPGKSKSRSSNARPQPVYIEWIDSYTTGEVWTTKPDLEHDDQAVVHTIGYVIHETKDKVTIVHSIGAGDDDEVGGDMSIPKVAIRKMRELRLPRK